MGAWDCRDGVVDRSVHAVEGYLHNIDVHLSKRINNRFGDDHAVAENIDHEVVVTRCAQDLGEVRVQGGLTSRERHIRCSDLRQLCEEIEDKPRICVAETLVTLIAVYAPLIAPTGDRYMRSEYRGVSLKMAEHQLFRRPTHPHRI